VLRSLRGELRPPSRGEDGHAFPPPLPDQGSVPPNPPPCDGQGAAGPEEPRLALPPEEPQPSAERRPPALTGALFLLRSLSYSDDDSLSESDAEFSCGLPPPPPRVSISMARSTSQPHSSSNSIARRSETSVMLFTCSQRLLNSEKLGRIPLEALPLRLCEPDRPKSLPACER